MSEEKEVTKETVEVKKEKLPKEKKKKNEEVIKLQEEKMALNEKLLRITAEMQNMRRRYEEEINNIYKYEGEDLIKKILPIVDNFERAIKLDDTDLSDELSKFLEGFKMIYALLMNALAEKEVKVIDCLNKEFDPKTMEAVLTQHEDNVLPGIVLDVMQKGYTYKDKVLRVAMVKVSE